MVGRLNLPNVCEGDPLDVMSCRADRGLDSPDSGLPPSPSPSAWLLPACAEKAGGVSPVSEDEGRGSLVGNTNATSCLCVIKAIWTPCGEKGRRPRICSWTFLIGNARTFHYLQFDMEDLAHCEEFSPPRMRSLMVSTNAWVDVLSLQFEKTGSKPWNEVLLSASRTVPIHQHMSQFWVKRTKCLKGLWLACMFGASEESGSLQCWPFEVLAPHVLTVGPHFIVFVFLALQVPVLPTGSFQQLQPLSFVEGIALDPLPAKEIRWVHIRPEEMLLKKKLEWHSVERLPRPNIPLLYSQISAT